MDRIFLYWADITDYAEQGRLDLYSRIVILDHKGNEQFCKLDWIKENGFERPILILEKED